jgi:hypothetical protein
MAKKNTLVLSDGTQCNYETEKGMLDGQYRSYYENGKLKSEGTFSKNNRLGFWVFYKPDGKIQCMRDYKNNYSFEEKSADNKSKNVVLNANNSWTPIQEKNILSKVRYFGIMLQSENTDLFKTENLFGNVLKAVKEIGKPVYTDSRFVQTGNPDVPAGSNIVGFKIKEDRIVDRATQTLHYRIIGIAPLVKTEGPNGESKVNELFWIHYEDIKSELAIMMLKNVPDHSFCKTLLDVFEFRNFAEEIYDGSAAGTEPADKNINQPIFVIEKENTFITENFTNK